MSTNQSSASQDQAAAEKRRKRRERSAKSRTPEPKDIVSGAGQPLDVSVRRDLEEQLGHDFSQVRLHTDRDSAQLADMMGADAFAVGQDIFFREGTYRPGTADGQRLLAHELLHTVQNPHGLGTLRAGRDLGSVSLPQDTIEREAESTARSSVLGAMQDSVREEQQPATEIEEGQATPGWLRYATVDADRMRMEQLDPATLVDRLANGVVRSLRGDPADLSKRTRVQLARLPDELLDDVLGRLEHRLLGPEHDRVLDLVEEIESQGDHGADTSEWAAHDAPAVEPDMADDLRIERESEQRSAEQEKAREEKPALAAGPEKERAEAPSAPGSTPRNGGTPQSGTTPQGGGAPHGKQQSEEGAGKNSDASSPGKEPSGSAGGATAGKKEPSAEGSKNDDGQKSEAAQSDAKGGEDKKADEGKQSGEDKKSAEQKGADEKKTADDKKSGDDKKGAAGKEGAEQRDTAVASKEESAAKNRPESAEQHAAAQPSKQEDKGGRNKSGGSPTTAGKDVELPGRTSRLDGVRNQDLDGPEGAADDDPFSAGSVSEVEVGGAEKSAWDTKLQPEDFLPEQDLDVSGVASAENSDPASPPGRAMPTFPAPPPTRAEKVQAERDAEDAEDEAAEAEAEPEEAEEPLESTPSVETEGGPDDAFAGDPDVERLADSRPGAGAPSKDPKAGDDPKAGPVAAQKAVQESPGSAEGGGEAKEPAAKEEKGAKAGGDKAGDGAAGGAQEKESQKAAGGKAAAPETAGRGEEPKKDEQKNDGQKKAEPATADKADGGTAEKDGDKGQDSKSPSPARDTHVSGGSNADTPGGASNQATSGTQTDTSSDTASDTSSAKREQGGQSASSEGAHPQESKAPAAKESAKESAPAPKEAPQPAKSKQEPGAKEEPAAAAPKAAPAPKAPGGGGGGGGGGRSAAPAKGKKKDSGPAPNLSQVSPEAGLSSAARLKPHKALEAMGGVGGSVDRTVGDEHKQLAAAPPNMQRPAGAPQTLQGKPKTDAAAQYSQDPAKKSDAPKDEKAEVKGEKKPEGQIEAEKAEEPGGWDTFKMALGFGIGWVAEKLGFKVDKEELAAKFAGLPTKDEALKQAQAGNAPGVNMQGAADQKAGEQDQAVDSKGQEAVTTGRDDAGRSMGENQVYPNAPKEQLKGKVPGREGGKDGVRTGKASTGAVPAEAASTVAEHDRKPQFQQAFSKGRKDMSDGRQAKDKGFRESQQKHKQQVAGEVAKNTADQTGERTKAQSEVTSQRSDWRKEQDQELKKLGTKKSEKRDKVRKDVKEREKKTDDDTEKEKKDSDKKIKDKGDKAETDAKNKTDTAAKDSGNWLTKAFDWLKEKVLEIKNAIVRIIREARDAVVNFIKNFKENVERWINEARKWVVDTVKNLINDLIEFAKNMVKAVIELARRIRKFITDLIAAAIALVTKLAALLKKVITDLLNRIAKLLSDLLNILKKALMDVIKAVVDAVKTVLEYASKLLGALGEFMMIAVDFMDDPGGWLSGAKNSAVDGAKHHLFREVKNAVKQWFQSKIEEIIGIPKAIIDKLIKGGFTLEKIVKETWDAIVPQLPFIIGEIVITKVIAKLIPGAGWVMAVIDAIRTAIGALGEILRAMGAVLDWLKAVRQGGAGILFAKAVAAGIVALLELAYEALLNGIGKYVAKVGRRLKSVAAKLGKGNRDGRGAPSRAGAGDDQRPRDGGRQEAPRTAPGDRRDSPAGRPAPGHPADRSAPALPKPGKHTGPGTKPNAKPHPKSEPNKPATKGPGKPKDAAPGKPRDDKDAPGRPKDTDKDTPTRPKDQDGPNKPKDTDKDAPARPKDKDDTRPTPSPKPKPKPEPKPKPKDGPETKPKPKNDKDAPGKPKDDKDRPDTTKPKDDKDTPNKPKDNDKDPTKPRDGDKDKPTKPKDKDGDGKKPRDTKDSDHKRRPSPDRDHDRRKPRPKHDKKGPGRARPKDDKAGPGRPKTKPQKQKQKEKEGSHDDLGKRLAIITARIRARLLPLLDGDGMWEKNFDPLLTAMKNWYRLTSLRDVGDPDVSVVATLNPSSVPVRARRWRDRQLRQPKIALKQLREDGLPKPDLPAFNGSQASSMEARFLSRSVRGKGEEPGPHSNPPGWDYVASKGLSNASAWVRMHLLPEKLGGMASNNNLVPAPGPSVNTPMNAELEDLAYGATEAKGGMIWYKSSVDFHPLQKDSAGQLLKGFPQRITSTYGEYDHIKGSGKHRGDWKPRGATKTKSIGDIRLPSADEHTRLLINSARTKTIFNRLGGNADPDRPWVQISRYIAGLGTSGEKRTTERYGREVPDGHPHYYSVSDVRRYLETRKESMSPEVRRLMNPALAKLRQLAKSGQIDWKN